MNVNEADALEGLIFIINLIWVHLSILKLSLNIYVGCHVPLIYDAKRY